MERKEKEVLWVAVRVWRGFPDEARGFRKKADAEKQEQKWRNKMNPDYDGTGVLPLILSDR